MPDPGRQEKPQRGGINSGPHSLYSVKLQICAPISRGCQEDSPAHTPAQVYSPLCPPQVGFDIRVVQLHCVCAVIDCFFKFPKLQHQTQVSEPRAENKSCIMTLGQMKGVKDLGKSHCFPCLCLGLFFFFFFPQTLSFCSLGKKKIKIRSLASDMTELCECFCVRNALKTKGLPDNNPNSVSQLIPGQEDKPKNT